MRPQAEQRVPVASFLLIAPLPRTATRMTRIVVEGDPRRSRIAADSLALLSALLRLDMLETPSGPKPDVLTSHDLASRPFIALRHMKSIVVLASRQCASRCDYPSLPSLGPPDVSRSPSAIVDSSHSVCCSSSIRSPDLAPSDGTDSLTVSSVSWLHASRSQQCRHPSQGRW